MKNSAWKGAIAKSDAALLAENAKLRAEISYVTTNQVHALLQSHPPQ